MLCEAEFSRLYGRQAADIAFCPYRICPLGAHVDHNLGAVTGFALDRGVSIAFEKCEDGGVELHSMQFPGPVKFGIAALSDKKAGDWADYMRGAAKALAAKYEVKAGIRGVISGSLPIGGLSSSAAVTLAFLSALCRVNGISITGDEAVELSRSAEREFVGVNIGKLDQCCVIFSQKNKLLYYDTLDDSRSLIPLPGESAPVKFGVFFSGVARALVNSDYNLRVAELKEAATLLKRAAGEEADGEVFMRSVPFECYLEHKNCLPEKQRLRAEHYFTEQQRVEKGVEAWKRGDLEQLGALMTESGLSSINNWQAGSPELKALSEIISGTKGVYGGRFSGAGFNGSCIALVDPECEDAIKREVTEKYLKLFPHHAEAFAVEFCESGSGIKF